MAQFVATPFPVAPDARETGLWFVVRGVEVLVSEAGETGLLPPLELVLSLPVAAEPHYLGLLNGVDCFCVEVEKESSVPLGFRYAGLRDLFAALDDGRHGMAGRAVQIVEWDRNHQFCGRCGTETVRAHGERAKKCPKCGMMNFPRLSPAVITLVEHEGKALLARNAAFNTGMFSILAGFVEPGEGLEEAVRREIMEEVSVEVTDIRYFGSQPWPFPNSLMIGFNARYAGGEIKLDPTEIAEAGWFAPGEFPMIPNRISISRMLIDDFVARMGYPRLPD